ncbi:hypothetical protein AB0M23_26135 [Streptomyces sp. NPDC052077]|uniref:hypothetical protein n=1 Tax=Streptomyces sp. NPDC052077 TaxID=3154757 RepID=UPI003434E503
MAWNEWEELKAEALSRQRDSPHTRLNTLDGGSSGGSGLPGSYGDLKVTDDDLAGIGAAAFELHDDLWDTVRVNVPSSEAAAADLSRQGFALGSGLQHVADRWEEQLMSLVDACAQISNHLRVTKKLHDGDEVYIQRRLSSIAALDAGFNERTGRPDGEKAT